MKQHIPSTADRNQLNTEVAPLEAQLEGKAEGQKYPHL